MSNGYSSMEGYKMNCFFWLAEIGYRGVQSCDMAHRLLLRHHCMGRIIALICYTMLYLYCAMVYGHAYPKRSDLNLDCTLKGEEADFSSFSIVFAIIFRSSEARNMQKKISIPMISRYI